MCGYKLVVDFVFCRLLVVGFGLYVPILRACCLVWVFRAWVSFVVSGFAVLVVVLVLLIWFLVRDWFLVGVWVGFGVVSLFADLCGLFGCWVLFKLVWYVAPWCCVGFAVGAVLLWCLVLDIGFGVLVWGWFGLLISWLDWLLAICCGIVTFSSWGFGWLLVCGAFVGLLAVGSV